jgi:hypothetical protein
VQLVLFCFKPLEKALNTPPPVIAVNYAILLKIRKIGKGSIDVDRGTCSVFEQFFLRPCVLRTREWINRSLFY